MRMIYRTYIVISLCPIIFLWRLRRQQEPNNLCFVHKFDVGFMLILDTIKLYNWDKPTELFTPYMYNSSFMNAQTVTLTNFEKKIIALHKKIFFCLSFNPKQTILHPQQQQFFEKSPLSRYSKAMQKKMCLATTRLRSKSLLINKNR